MNENVYLWMFLIYFNLPNLFFVTMHLKIAYITLDNAIKLLFYYYLTRIFAYKDQ